MGEIGLSNLEYILCLAFTFGVPIFAAWIMNIDDEGEDE